MRQHHFSLFVVEGVVILLNGPFRNGVPVQDMFAENLFYHLGLDMRICRLFPSDDDIHEDILRTEPSAADFFRRTLLG